MAEQKTAGATSYTLRGRELTHDWLAGLFTSGADRTKFSRRQIIACRDLRRKTRTVKRAASC